MARVAEALLRDWQKQGEAFRKGGTEPSLQAAIDARAEWLFSTKIFAKADAAGRDSGSDAGDAGDGEWQSADGASEGEASGAETEGEEAEGEEAEGETGPPLWAEYDALDDLSSTTSCGRHTSRSSRTSASGMFAAAAAAGACAASSTAAGQRDTRTCATR